MHDVSDLWLASIRETRVSFAHRLVCFPHAGGGASSFHAWRGVVWPEWELLAIKYPGRDARWTEAPARCLHQLADAIADAIAPRLDRPTTFYGHSMGALVAFEVARRLRNRENLTHLIVAAHPAPRLAVDRDELSTLPTAALTEHLREMGGTPPAVLANVDLLELVLPAIRADFAICERYQPRPGPPLNVPITALGGDHDAGVAPTTLAAWRHESVGPFAHHIVEGGHFFSYAPGPWLLRYLGRHHGTRTGADACAAS